MSDSDRCSSDDDADAQSQGREIVMSFEDKISLEAELAGTSRDEAVIIVYGHYAEHWWNDALRDIPVAGADEDEVRHAMRRQIVSAICALESWLFEWVRDDIFAAATPAAHLFTRIDRQSVDDRIQTVTKKLYADGHLLVKPEFMSPDWQDLPRLVRHRDGLVHGVASLPRGTAFAKGRQAVPTPKQLMDWAATGPLETTRRAVGLVASFANAEPPDWMTVPDHDG